MFGILSLISGGLISGILYVVAAVKLGDAADEKEAPANRPFATASAPLYARSTSSDYSPVKPEPIPPGFSLPTPPTVASGSNFCSNCGRPTNSLAHFCRNCGVSLA